MNCKDFRDHWILTEEQGTLNPEARSHLAECTRCETFSHEQLRLKAHVRKLAESEHAPQALRERINQIIHQHSRRRPLQSRRVAIAAAIALLVGAGATFSWYHRSRQPSPERLAQEFITDHLHYLPGREQVVSDSPRQVESWFQGRVEFPVRVPEVPNAALQDARVCNISGRKAALLHYRHNPDDVLISLFVAEEPQAFERQEKPVTLVTSIQGLNSNLWCHRGLVYDVVAALDDSSLQQIAESVRKQEP